MSDYSAAEIWIGGKVSASVARELCQAISIACLSLEWGDASFTPTSADDLVAACKEREGVKLLWLCNDRARWGQLDDLEAFLVDQRIAFDRISEAGCEYHAERVSFRPGQKPVRAAIHRTGVAVASGAVLESVRNQFDALIGQFTQGNIERGVAMLRRLRRFVRQQTPKVLPGLTPFEIIARSAKAPQRRNRKR